MAPIATGIRRVPLATALLGLTALAACGSAVSDSRALDGAARPAAYAGSITVASEPPGARCVLTDTATATEMAIITTPAPVALPRSTHIIEASCSAPGRMQTTQAIRPVRDFAEGIHHPQPIGTGIAQNAVVVRSGSTRRYNDTTIHLPPMPFASAAARDAWFTDRAAALRQEATPGIARAQRSANATIDTAEVLTGYLNADLARLDRQKALATIATEPAAAPRPR